MVLLEEFTCELVDIICLYRMDAVIGSDHEAKLLSDRLLIAKYMHGSITQGNTSMVYVSA